MTRAKPQERPYTEPLLSRAREETSLLGFVNVLLKHRRLIGGTTLLATIVFLASSLKEPRYYSTRALFIARGSPSGLVGDIAAQFGLSIVGNDPSQSIEFYEDLLRSPELLRAVAKRQYAVRTQKGIVRGQLPVFYGIHAGSRDAEVDLAALKIRDAISTNATRRTGIISFVYSAPYADLAQQVAGNMVDELDRFNTERRRSQITAERKFIEERLADAHAALSVAEDNMRSFRELNREYATSPRLSLENDRLKREVDMRQNLYTSLSGEYDKARIAEVRDMPVISIVEPPELPTSPNVTYGLRDTLLGAIAGMFVGIVIAFIRERMNETRREGSAAFAAYSALKRAAMTDLARPWRPVGKLFRPQSS